jgi:DNA-binding MarR family transcriptional regulator
MQFLFPPDRRYGILAWQSKCFLAKLFYHRNIWMSNDKHSELVAQVGQAVAEFQNAVDLVDEAASARLGINRTDLRCLGLLFARGPLSAGQLAQANSLSPGATTTALDRLERAGYARRLRDPADRRGILVELTPEARRRIDEIYGPIGQEGIARLARYSAAELVLLRDFLREGHAMQVAQAARIRGEPAPPTGSATERNV